MLLDDIQDGDLVIFANGDEAIVEHAVRGCYDVELFFNKKVLGSTNTSSSWSYDYDGIWFGGGNNIVKVVHIDGGYT